MSLDGITQIVKDHHETNAYADCHFKCGQEVVNLLAEIYSSNAEVFDAVTNVYLTGIPIRIDPLLNGTWQWGIYFNDNRAIMLSSIPENERAQ